MTHDRHKELIEEWNGLCQIIDPAKETTGDTQKQKDALMHNINVFPHFIEVARNELIGLESQYRKEYLALSKIMTKDYCETNNIKGNQHNIYIEKTLALEPGDIGNVLTKQKNILKRLEEDAVVQLNLLWTYNKENRI